MNAKTVVLIVVAALVLLLIVQNSHDVFFRFLFWSIDIPLILLTPLLVILGFVSGFTVAKLTGKKTQA
ncbi:DUF1049 domain-containing protein [bacterium]|nr:DUF1049 domain-containing protein [bacterium]